MRPGDRLLIPLTYGFSVRYLVPTGLLEQLTAVCTPVVGLGWHDERLQARLEGFGVEVVRLPDAELSEGYRAHRNRMAVLHEARLASPTSRIRRERDLRSYPTVARTISRARRWSNQLAMSIPGRAEEVERLDDAAVRDGTNAAAFAAVLRNLRADAVLTLTPYHDQDALLAWAAKRSDVRVVVSVISFDNPTTRSRSLECGDVVSVWNRHMAAQLDRAYPALDPTAVHVIGAPQFDLHHRRDLVVDRRAWLDAVGAPPDRPVVLYGASPSHLVPDEPALVRAIDDSIAAGRIAGDPFLVVRPHPVDRPDVWHDVAIRHGVVTDASATTGSPMLSWPDEDDLRLQMSALAHSEVHMNICSSMTIDGSMFDRPQIGPDFVPGASGRTLRQIRSMYLQEHWCPIERAGALERVGDVGSLERAVSGALGRPAERAPQRRAMLEELLTFPEGGAVLRLVDLIAAS